MKKNSKTLTDLIALLQNLSLQSLTIVTAKSVGGWIGELEKIFAKISIVPEIVEEIFPTNDLCLVMPDMTLSKVEVGKLKNVLAQRIIIQTKNLKPEELSELGFLKLELKGAENFYSYNLDSYNKKRNWNSPEGWANPDNFDKYRW